MLKKIVNEAHFTVRITTTGPLLIKSGRATVSGPDMTPVLTYRNGKQEVFIPGSSLKGVFRSHVERVVGSLKPHVICYPFSGNENNEADTEQRQKDYRESCGVLFNSIAKQREENSKLLEAHTDIVYAASCPTCRLFGSTSFIGRVAISDAYLTADTNEIKEFRDGVGIDRLTGGASHGAKFELEVVSTGVTFETTVHLRNFELWQLGMLFIVLQDMEDGLIHLGSGRSRGLGKVTAKINMAERDGQVGGLITSTIRDAREPAEQLWGLGKWLASDGSPAIPSQVAAELELALPGDGAYGTWHDDFLELTPSVERSNKGIRTQRVFNDITLGTLRNATINQFVQRMQAWPQEVHSATPSKKR